MGLLFRQSDGWGLLSTSVLRLRQVVSKALLAARGYRRIHRLSK